MGMGPEGCQGVLGKIQVWKSGVWNPLSDPHTPLKENRSPRIFYFLRKLALKGLADLVRYALTQGYTSNDS